MHILKVYLPKKQRELIDCVGKAAPIIPPTGTGPLQLEEASMIKKNNRIKGGADDQNKGIQTTRVDKK